MTEDDTFQFGDVYEPSTVLDPKQAWLVVSNNGLNDTTAHVMAAFLDQGSMEESGLLHEHIAGCGTADLYALTNIRKTSLGRKIGELPRNQWESVGLRLRSIFGP